jgi:hypothetical protein
MPFGVCDASSTLDSPPKSALGIGYQPHALRILIGTLRGFFFVTRYDSLRRPFDQDATSLFNEPSSRKERKIWHHDISKMKRKLTDILFPPGSIRSGRWSGIGPNCGGYRSSDDRLGRRFVRARLLCLLAATMLSLGSAFYLSQ